jgi:hypothetical protein
MCCIVNIVLQNLKAEQELCILLNCYLCINLVLMRNVKLIIFVAWCFLFLFLSPELLAQNRNDFGVWAGMKVEQKILKELSIGVKAQVRLNGNAAYFKSAFTNVGVGYKFHKMFSLSAGYRYSIRVNKNTHRAYLDAKLNYQPVEDLGLRFKLRVRGQYDTSNDLTADPSVTLRSRLYIGFTPKGKVGKKFTIYTTGEIFYEFVQSYSSFKKWRYSAGMMYHFNKDIALNLRYVLQDGIETVAPIMDHVFVVGMVVDLPKIKRKKKKKDD